MELKARVWKPEGQIKEIAQELAQKIYVETSDGDGHWRFTTEKEEEILWEIFDLALSTLNFYHSGHDDLQRGMDDGVIHMAEACTIRRLPHANSYLTTYCVLKKIVREWERE